MAILPDFVSTLTRKAQANLGINLTEPQGLSASYHTMPRASSSRARIGPVVVSNVKTNDPREARTLCSEVNRQWQLALSFCFFFFSRAP